MPSVCEFSNLISIVRIRLDWQTGLQEMADSPQTALRHTVQKVHIQRVQRIGRLVVMRVAQKTRVCDHQCRIPHVPERTVITQARRLQGLTVGRHLQRFDRQARRLLGPRAESLN